jgi:hypothetical protein
VMSRLARARKHLAQLVSNYYQEVTHDEVAV